MSYPSLAVTELALIGVADAGVPNQERVIIRPTQAVDLRNFAVLAGKLDRSTGGAAPYFDAAFWFPADSAAPPSWLVVYTGRGTPRRTVAQNGDVIQTFFWQRQHTLFGAADVVPVLIRLDAAVVGRKL